MYSYRSIQVVLQRNTIYRLTSIIFCCILPYSHLEELAGKTNHLFWCPEDLLAPPQGRWKTLLHSTSETYSQVIQTGWGFIKLHWEMRKIRRKHLNLFPPSPLTSMYKITCSGDTLMNSSNPEQRLGERDEEGTKHHTAWIVFVKFKVIAFNAVHSEGSDDTCQYGSRTKRIQP